MDEEKGDRAVLPKEVSEANTTAYVVNVFSSQMLFKMQKYQGCFQKPWPDKNWEPGELEKEIFRCILDGDFVSIANYAMIGQYQKGKLCASEGVVQPKREVR